jgi:hypothetical protein
MTTKQPEKTPNKGGRPKGSANKTTAEARAAFNSILKGRAKKVGGWIDKVAKTDPARACGLLLDLAEFCVAKPTRIEIANAPNPDGTEGEVVFRVKRD